MKSIILSLLLTLPMTSVMKATDTETVKLTEGHIDLICLEWNAEEESPLQIMLEDEANETTYAPEACVIVCPEKMKLTIPTTSPLGNEGDSLWIFPQSHYAGVPFLGACAEEIPNGIFEAPLQILLSKVEGPGQFIVWQSNAGTTIFMDSRDGISDADCLEVPAGAHAHYNWGFTSNGTYKIYFQASATQVGESEPVVSKEVCYTFLILPSPFASWQNLYWPTGGPLAAPDADPDGDGIVNLIEYATGTNPLEFTSTSPLTCRIRTEEGQPYCICELTQSITATDCLCEVIALQELRSKEGIVLEQTNTLPLDENRQRISFQDPLPIITQNQRFYRLKVSLR